MAAALAAMSSGCTTTKHEPKRGELVLYLETDLSIPKDVSSIRVEVVQTGRVQFAQTYLVGPAPLLQMPATLSIVAGKDPSEPVSIRILARQVPKGADADRGIPRVLREIVTTVPEDRSALLPVPLQWLCADDKSLVVSGDEVSTACGEGETCVAGSCEPQEVDSSKLADFDPKVTEGIAPDSGCFDVLTCVGGAPLAPVDAQTCTVPAPAGDPSSWNVALRLPLDSGGTCDDAHCFVPLNEGAEGWSEGDAGTIQLPAAVCEGDTPLEVVTSVGCPTKTTLMPVCGPATRFDSAAPGTPDMPIAGGTQGQGGMGSGGSGGGVGGGPGVGGGGPGVSVPEVVMLQGITAPRHVVVEPLGVFFLAQAQDGTDGVFWCALAGCDSQAQVQWQGAPGAIAQGFAHNSTQLDVWAWDQQTIQIHGCAFPGGCSSATAKVLASSDALNPPLQALQGTIAMTETSVLFREVEPSARIQSCSMLDTGCDTASPTLFTDTSPVISLTTSGGTLVWANAAGELKYCQLDDCPGTVAVSATGQLFSWGPVFVNESVVWGSDRIVRACTLSDCAATEHDLFSAVSPVTALASDGKNAYFGFLRTPQPPVHDLVKVPLDGSTLGQTLRSGSGIITGTGVDGDFVYSFVVDPNTMIGDLVRTSTSAMPMPMP
jgi:hypothetical protein